ncbi:NAD(P)-dependent dehydrogenase (short-subunit alcohol dehydrogenase family) [Humitalea rosea]|uniref:NAD(P)-dependent dehydrogenase (Short-subunit alcohol dehydrogenase family) n=1 Tax=Humitalea rosea TaxID=990373 RepID=A0A2W7IMJ4_9PROT|nr:SDR family oxidoreductase [Humitalea rosea]PZW48055.1 NAD(P)-dependent dehydrogenase (short-subunit alcohol dehydrogenase family) [Humitalea rosea]
MAGVLVVTGASRGIGAATARLAAARGWRVVGSFLERRDAAEAVAEEIRAAGGEVEMVQADTSVEADVTRLFDTAEAHFGKVTGLVNNAGMNGGPASLVDLPVAELRRLIDINVIGPMLCAREAVRRMATDRGGPGGAIVNLGSVAAVRGSPGERVHYAASKGAVISLTIGLAQEVARNGIRVNAVSPGLTETEMNPADRLARLVPTVPIGRVAAPEEVARVILFLLSPEASYVLGINVTVSGGR